MSGRHSRSLGAPHVIRQAHVIHRCNRKSERERVLKKRFIVTAINVTLVVVSIAFAFGLTELGAWIWVTKVRPEHLTRWEFRATQPPPYQGADYFGKDFLAEAESSVSGRISRVTELNDFKGRYFNIVDGFRLTTDAPANADRSVLLFGGSTLFGQEVPDRYTIASYLQRMLNAEGVQWQVRNFGLPGMNAAQQTLILEQVKLRAGDIVVYYHGVNDIYYLVFGGYPDGWVGGIPAFRPVQKLSAFHKWMHTWHERLKDYSYTAQVALDIYQRGQPKTVTDATELERLLMHTEAHFRSAVVAADELSKAAGATFVHFLQPTAFTRAALTSYEQEILKNPLQTAPGLELAFKEGYPRLRRVATGLLGEGIEYHDISDSFDGRPTGSEVLLDFCHVNHEGNRLVAQRMMEVYFRPLLAR